MDDWRLPLEPRRFFFWWGSPAIVSVEVLKLYDGSRVVFGGQVLDEISIQSTDAHQSLGVLCEEDTKILYFQYSRWKWVAVVMV